MRNIATFFTILGTLFLLSTATQAQNIKKLDEKNGFRDAQLGSDFSAFQDLVLIEGESTDNTKFYKRTSDNLNLGETTLSEIIYGFYKGKLSSIVLKTKGYSNSRSLHQTLQAQYGNGYQSNRFIERYGWSGKNVILSYSEESLSKDASVYFWSRPLAEQEKKDEKEAAAKAAADL